MIKISKLTLLLYSVLITIGFVSLVWPQDQQALTVPKWEKARQHAETNPTTGLHAIQQNPPATSRSLYGKASLSEEEKQILAEPFKDLDYNAFRYTAYKVGMICLKHRLTSVEISELITGHPVFSSSGEHLTLKYGISLFKSLKFQFDSKGNLLDIFCFPVCHCDFPPLELVTPDAPVKLPPLPHYMDPMLRTAELISQEHLTEDVTDPHPKPRSFRGMLYNVAPEESIASLPDLNSLSYIDVKTAFDLMFGGGIAMANLPPEHVLRIISQLQKKNLSDQKKALVIYLLGQTKPHTNSIAALIERIDFKVNVPHNDTNWPSLYPWSLYPSRDALLRIGEISVGPIVQDLPGETNALRRQLLCAVVSTFGRTNWTTAWQPKAAIEQLQRLRATESEQSRQHNIDEALGLLIDNKVDVNIGWSGYFGE